MQHTTKMVMVPQDAYSSLISQQKQLYSPVVNQLANLDNDLQSIMSNPNMSADAKYHQYMNTFNRYQQLRKEQFPVQRNPTFHQISTEIQTAEDIPMMDFPVEERRIIDSLPKPVRRKGKILLEHMKDKKEHFNWLNSGELVFNGTPIHGSNFTDLVHYFTRNQPNSSPPTGAEQFENLLNITNAPKEALNTAEIKFKNPKTELGTSFSPATASTPKITKTPLKKSVKKSPKKLLTRERKPVQKYGNWLGY